MSFERLEPVDLHLSHICCDRLSIEAYGRPGSVELNQSHQVEIAYEHAHARGCSDGRVSEMPDRLYACHEVDVRRNAYSTSTTTLVRAVPFATSS